MSICFEKGWGYERDWLSMSKGDRAKCLAYVNVEAWRMEEEQRDRKREAATK